jgi:hypothetical protein
VAIYNAAFSCKEIGDDVTVVDRWESGVNPIAARLSQRLSIA